MGELLDVLVVCRPPTPSPAEREAYEAMLTADEHTHRAEFHHAIDADRFLVGRGMLRREVGQLLGVAPRDVPLELGAHGKPIVIGGPHVNVSHSGDAVVLALCADSEVGVDVEQLDGRYANRRLMQRSFSDRELANLHDLPTHLFTQAFFHVWASREAVMKLTGAGFSLPRDSFDVSVDPREPPRVIRAEPPVPCHAVRLIAIAAPAGHLAVLAIAGARPARLIMR